MASYLVDKMVVLKVSLMDENMVVSMVVMMVD
jgi:hypothetical protein